MKTLHSFLTNRIINEQRRIRGSFRANTKKGWGTALWLPAKSREKRERKRTKERENCKILWKNKDSSVAKRKLSKQDRRGRSHTLSTLARESVVMRDRRGRRKEKEFNIKKNEKRATEEKSLQRLYEHRPTLMALPTTLPYKRCSEEGGRESVRRERLDRRERNTEEKAVRSAGKKDGAETRGKEKKSPTDHSCSMPRCLTRRRIFLNFSRIVFSTRFLYTFHYFSPLFFFCLPFKKSWARETS